MAPQRIFWDLDDDPEGNVQHIAEHGLTQEEVEDVLLDPDGEESSHSSGLPIVFGRTRFGDDVTVVYEPVDALSVRPVTAWKTEEK